MACNISKENLASMFIQDNFSSIFTILKNNHGDLKWMCLHDVRYILCYRQCLFLCLMLRSNWANQQILLNIKHNTNNKLPEKN